MNPLPVRLRPGVDLRRELERIAAQSSSKAMFVVSGIGSLGPARLRLAGRDEVCEVAGASELLSLSGTLAENGSHLHATVADSEGRVWGGHVATGCIVRTTAEILLAELPQWRLTRAPDPETGWAELQVAPRT